MSKHQEAKKILTKSSESASENQDQLLENSVELAELINSPDFIKFVQTISDSVDDNITFNEMLSSREILQKALTILKKIREE